jgi:hypothetical protein
MHALAIGSSAHDPGLPADHGNHATLEAGVA